jgi:sortase A
MKRIVIAILMMLVGIGILVYPTVSEYLYARSGIKGASQYDETIAAQHTTEIEKLWAEAERYNENLTGSPVHDPFLDGSGIAMPENYSQILNIDGTMAYVEIPRINVYLPIYHGTDDETLTRGVGHLEGSTLPIGGDSRHSVLTGHSALTNARMFTDLVDLEIGDLFYIHVLDQVLAYRIDQVKVIVPHVTEDLQRFEGKDYCTLLTCTPYGINSHRLLVRGERTEYVSAEKDQIAPIADTQSSALVRRTAIITGSIMAILVAVSWALSRRRTS